MIAAVLAAAGIGSAFMFLVDPQRGRRRRALLRDQWVRAVSRGERAARATARDMRNRARGIVAEGRSLLARDTPSDAVIEECVRARIGQYVSHSAAIDVSVSAGRVGLRGPILGSEVGRLRRAIGRVRGVADVDDGLDIHETPGDVPALQGGRARSGERFELLQTTWSPTARMAVGATGAGLLVAGALRRGGLGAACGVAALGLLLRALRNEPLRAIAAFGLEAVRRPRA